MAPLILSLPPPKDLGHKVIDDPFWLQNRSSFFVFSAIGPSTTQHTSGR